MHIMIYRRSINQLEDIGSRNESKISFYGLHYLELNNGINSPNFIRTLHPHHAIKLYSLSLSDKDLVPKFETWNYFQKLLWKKLYEKYLYSTLIKRLFDNTQISTYSNKKPSRPLYMFHRIIHMSYKLFGSFEMHWLLRIDLHKSSPK